MKRRRPLGPTPRVVRPGLSGGWYVRDLPLRKSLRLQGLAQGEDGRLPVSEADPHLAPMAPYGEPSEYWMTVFTLPRWNLYSSRDGNPSQTTSRSGSFSAPPVNVRDPSIAQLAAVLLVHPAQEESLSGNHEVDDLVVRLRAISSKVGATKSARYHASRMNLVERGPELAEARHFFYREYVRVGSRPAERRGEQSACRQNVCAPPRGVRSASESSASRGALEFFGPIPSAILRLEDVSRRAGRRRPTGLRDRAVDS